MGSGASKPEYTGMDKYPGWIATIITVIIGAVFIGALIKQADHGDHHGDAHHGEEHKAGDAKGDQKENSAH